MGSWQDSSANISAKASTVRNSGAAGVSRAARAERPTGLANVKRVVIMDVVRADAEPGLRILLVERDPIDAAVLVQPMRASQGVADVVTAASLSAAVDVLRREAIDTIFCSVAAQDMDVLRALIRTAKPRPVVALVGEAESEIRNQAIQAGAVRALCKERLLSSFAERVVRAARDCPDRIPAYA
jgi:CheY-like chemotaxis protein